MVACRKVVPRHCSEPADESEQLPVSFPTLMDQAAEVGRDRGGEARPQRSPVAAVDGILMEHGELSTGRLPGLVGQVEQRAKINHAVVHRLPASGTGEPDLVGQLRPRRDPAGPSAEAFGQK